MSNSRAALPAHDLLRGVDLPVGAGRRKFAVALSGGYCGARGAVGPDEREEEVMLPASTASELLSLAEQGDMTLGEVLKEALSALRAVREGGSGSAVGGDPNGAALPDGGDEYQNSEGPYCHHDSTRKRLPPFPPSWGSSITTPVGCLEPVLPLVFGLLDPNNDVPSARLVCRGWAKIGFAAVESLQLNHRETFVLQKPLLLRTGDGEADPPAGGVMWEGGRSVHHALPSDWAERLPGLRHLELSDDSDSGTWRNASEKLILGLRSLTQLTRLTISSIRQHLLPHELQCLVVPSCMQPEKLLAAAASSFETLVHLETLDSPVPLLVGEDEAAERRTVASLQLFTGLQSLSLAASRPQSLLLVGRCIPDYMRCMRSLVIAVAVTSNSDMVAIGAGLNCLDPDICSLTLNVTYGKAEEDDEEVLSKESVQAVRSMAGIPSLTALNMKNFRVTQVEQSLRDRSSLKSLCVVDCRMDVPQAHMLTLGWPLVTSLRGLDLPVNSIDPTSDASIIINFQLCRASCRNLQSLSLVGCINVPNYLGPLLQEVPQLTSLDLSMNGSLGARHIRTLGHMTCLTHLNLVAAFDGTELSCQPSCLKPLCSLPVLRILDLRNNVWMSLSHVASLRPVVSRLSYLGLGKFFTHGFDIGVMRSNDIPKSACYNAFLDQADSEVDEPHSYVKEARDLRDVLSVLAPPGARHRYADCELLPLAKDLASLSAPMDAPFMQTGLSGKLLKDDEYCYCHWEGCQGPTKHVRSKWLRQQVL